MKLKTETKLCVKIYFAWQSKHCRKTLRWVFKFWKYYAAHNSGLKIWLVSGIFEMAQLFNLKFCVYLCWLGAGFSPQFSSRRTLNAIYFPNLRRKLRSYFSVWKFLKIVTEKSCVTIETRTELCVEISCVKICCAWQTKFAWHLKPENRTLSINFASIFLSSENIILHLTAV